MKKVLSLFETFLMDGFVFTENKIVKELFKQAIFLKMDISPNFNKKITGFCAVAELKERARRNKGNKTK